MIIADLLGGLGNQLFQYAAGIALAERYDVPFKINIKKFEEYKLHKYSLHHFNISAPIANTEEVEYYGNTAAKIWERLILKPYYKRRVFKERFLYFDKNINNASHDIMLNGYWQSEMYFATIADFIRKEFAIKSPIDDVNRGFADEIRNTNSVSIHIRRGDYVSDSVTNNIHGTCDREYYNVCVEKIVKLVNDPVFYIFSDDPSWVKSNFNLKYSSVLIEHNNADTNYEDLRLMGLCKHNIIANSSFSWWGAWLNANPGKNVFAPSNWFKTSSRNSKDIIPGNWNKI